MKLFDINLSNQFLGKVLLEQADTLAVMFKIAELKAEVLPHNKASQKLFKSLGYTEEQKDELFKSGNFTPGDFGTLYKKLKFVSKEKINSEFICQELISLAKLKNNGFEKPNKIGFSI